MSDKITNEAMFGALADLAERFGVEVRERVLKAPGVNVQSGLCQVRGRPMLILERKLPLSDKISVMAEALAGMPVDEVYLMPAVRDLLERYRTSPVTPDKIPLTASGRDARSSGMDPRDDGNPDDPEAEDGPARK
ncbi:MAG: hypothetical protein ACLFOY_01870 [Desulfatibacillaceae bacterium]